jgi:hypothetical protein
MLDLGDQNIKYLWYDHNHINMLVMEKEMKSLHLTHWFQIKSKYQRAISAMYKESLEEKRNYKLLVFRNFFYLNFKLINKNSYE